VHGIAGSLGGMIPAPHGLICARLLPLVAEANIGALASRSPASPALTRYREVAQILTGSPSASAEEGIRWMVALCETLHIGPLSDLGLTEAMLPELSEKSFNSSSMKGNPVGLTEEELMETLKRAL